MFSFLGSKVLSTIKGFCQYPLQKHTNSPPHVVHGDLVHMPKFECGFLLYKNWCAKEMDLLLFYVWPLLFLITLHLWHAHKVPEKCSVRIDEILSPVYIYLYMSSGYFTELDAIYYTLILW